MIPYDSMLAVLAGYFSEHGTNVPLEHKTWLDKWFWRSAFSERYSKASNTQMASDAKAIRELIGGKFDVPNYPLTISKEDLLKMRMNRASGAARNGVLCLLARAKPKNFVTGADIALVKDHFSDLKDPNAHHVFPKTTTRYQETSRVWVCFGIGCSRTGGARFAAGVRNAGSPGHASSPWLSVGFLNRKCSIPFLTLALPPVI